jgi:hypothetical protein
MKLDNLRNRHVAKKALKENFNVNFDPSSLDKTSTTKMLNKVRGLIKEARSTPAFNNSQRNPAYLKLLFMEQALVEHSKVAKGRKIVVESESVERSQVILAAQDMVDTVQDMYENVNDMLVKELPALVDSIQSEIGANESSQFSDKVNGILTDLNSKLQEAQNGLREALGVVTGEETAPSFDDEGPEPDLDMDMEPEGELDMDLDMDLEGPSSREEEIKSRAVGRELR